MKIIKDISFEFWWDVAENCPYATFFHSPLWHKLIDETYEDKVNSPMGAIGENGTKMVLPLLQSGTTTKGLFKNIVSTYAGCYGGVIADGPVLTKDSIKLYEEVLKGRTGKLKLTGNPLWKEFDEKGWPKLFDEDVTDDFTHILKLNLSMDEIESNFSRGHRSSMNKGIELGVKVREADSLEDYQNYYNAYEASLERWGDEASSVYSWDLFNNCFRLSQQHPDNIKVWLAELENGELASAALIFYWNVHMDYWHGVAYKEHFEKRPNNVLHPHIIEDGLKNDYKFYDFNPSGGHEGVANFKKRFGAEKWALERIEVSSDKKNIIDRLRKGLFS